MCADGEESKNLFKKLVALYMITGELYRFCFAYRRKDTEQPTVRNETHAMHCAIIELQYYALSEDRYTMRD